MWTKNLKRMSEKACGENSGFCLWRKYADLFPDDYRLLISPRHALGDMLQLEKLPAPQERQPVSLLKPDRYYPHYRLHFYSQEPRYLDEFIPVLENLYLRVMDQVQFSLSIENRPLFIKSFSVQAADGQTVSFESIEQPLLETIRAVMGGRLENDAINKLVTLTGLDWQACDVLRTYRNYYLQLDHRTSKTSIHQALINNHPVAKALFEYFEARFRPNPVWQDAMVREEQVLFALRLQLLEAMAAVESLNEDRILRTFFNLIDATVRSNFHQRLRQDDYFIAIKIDSLGVIDMPSPKPIYEIYVHAVDMEGIHLRGGKVSRGGIRWSDRIDDFRTEILDLMQTQISKNALIIPTGAKGGFVVKQNPTHPRFREAGKLAYVRFMRGLLDLTDNYCGDQIICPDQVVAHDDLDPYLVVAADKGTAKFSDIANGIAADYRFWLGDAFASGGSHGYDHKALGITARGAWECVKRHFRELGKDIQNQPFTVIGIGSMDGDVFGNGMLQSPQIRLLAAFSGQHIFLDPNPPAGGGAFNERRRLFELPGSSWNDYDRSLISAGGGVFSRADKDIPLSAEIKKWLGIRFKAIDGESLIQYLLKTPVELLWLGGIGTYVKASTEKHEDVGDRGNDNVRLDACDLKALVVGEGANLGFTQKARVEYALHGGRINTDAVDNSAGVDTSDHEVNLKILLAKLHKNRLVDDYQGLFIELTDAVCQSVLADNYAQSLCLSLEQRRNADNPAMFIHVAERLDAAGFLDRAVESFPLTGEIQARPEQALTRPELAVLMSAAKMYLTQQLEGQTERLPNPCYDYYLQTYFPAVFREQFGTHLSSHPLAHEIKATVISNTIINQCGCGFLSLDDSENGQLMAYVDAYLTFGQVLQAEALRNAVYRLDNKIPTESQYRLLLQLEQTLSEFCRWSVIHKTALSPDSETIDTYRRFLGEYRVYLKQHAGDALASQIKQYQAEGVPKALAEPLALIGQFTDFPFMVLLVNETGQDFLSVGLILHDVRKTLSIQDIVRQLAQTPLRDYWVKTVCTTLQVDIQRYTALLVKQILRHEAGSCAQYLEQHVDQAALKHYRKIYLENRKTNPVNLLAYVVLVRALESVAAG
jgi:glutamate dehydrogenase